jgi:hypothetical protein
MHELHDYIDTKTIENILPLLHTLSYIFFECKLVNGDHLLLQFKNSDIRFQ